MLEILAGRDPGSSHESRRLSFAYFMLTEEIASFVSDAIRNRNSPVFGDRPEVLDFRKRISYYSSTQQFKDLFSKVRIFWFSQSFFSTIAFCFSTFMTPISFGRCTSGRPVSRFSSAPSTCRRLKASSKRIRRRNPAEAHSRWCAPTTRLLRPKTLFVISSRCWEPAI